MRNDNEIEDLFLVMNTESGGVHTLTNRRKVAELLEVNETEAKKAESEGKDYIDRWRIFLMPSLYEVKRADITLDCRE